MLAVQIMKFDVKSKINLKYLTFAATQTRRVWILSSIDSWNSRSWQPQLTHHIGSRLKHFTLTQFSIFRIHFPSLISHFLPACTNLHFLYCFLLLLLIHFFSLSYDSTTLERCEIEPLCCCCCALSQLCNNCSISNIINFTCSHTLRHIVSIFPTFFLIRFWISLLALTVVRECGECAAATMWNISISPTRIRF